MPRVRLAAGDQAPVDPERAAERRTGRAPGRRRRLLLRWRMRLPALGDLVPSLESVLGTRRPRRVTRPGAKRAAVAVIFGGTADPALVLIRRNVRSGDPWSGQMAFPGGFQASEAEALETTASRETAEETGLDLSARGRILGALDDVSPRTPYLPPLIVAPFVFAVPDRPALTPGEEADEALWVGVGEIFDPANRTSFTLSLPSGKRDFPAIQVGEHVVWGLTERILRQVADLVQL